jgi:membrane fusion protein, multidrug efflux system
MTPRTQMRRPAAKPQDKPAASPWSNPLVRILAAIALIVAVSLAGGLALAGEPEGRIRGVVRPITHSSVSVDLPARVLRINVLEGERFKKGDVIIEFDCKRQRAELAGAMAQHREMMLAVESQRFLQRHNAAARLDLETAKAKADRAAADVAATQARIDQCSVIAPFDGRVAELAVRPMEIPIATRPIITIHQDSAFEIELLVPSAWLVWLTAGTSFTFLIDETQRTYTVGVHRLGAAVETVSQMVKVIGRLDNVDGTIISGMSGTAVFARDMR